jgi:hypothetical protein
MGAAILMFWPAVYNGYPLLYPDSMSYLQDGPRVARAVFLHELSPYYGGRSFIYAMGIVPFHWNVTPWPVVGLQSLVTAWTLWLVVRSFVAMGTLVAYGATVLGLCLLTGLAWFTSFIMPDIFGPVLYLCIYLMAFGWEGLARLERVGVMVVAWWAAAAHSTHLPLGLGLCVVAAVVLIAQRQPTRRWLAALGRGVTVILLAAVAHLALHAYLYGQPSLTGQRAPFLTARLVADGPGRWYLQQHCDGQPFALCGEWVGRSACRFVTRHIRFTPIGPVHRLSNWR